MINKYYVEAPCQEGEEYTANDAVDAARQYLQDLPNPEDCVGLTVFVYDAESVQRTDYTDHDTFGAESVAIQCLSYEGGIDLIEL